MPERAVLYLAIAQTLIWASSSYIFAALLLWWEADFGWSRGALTGAFTAALLTMGICSPLAGKLIDQGRGAVMMWVCTTLTGIFVGLLSFTTEIWQFYVLWIAIGVTMSGCLYEPCFSLITKARGPQGRPSIVVITLLAGFASTLSFPLGNALAEAFGWRVAMQIFCAIAILVAAPLMWLGARQIENNPHEVETSSSKMDEGQGRGYLYRPEFWFLGLAFACGAMLQQLTVNHLLPILADRNVLRDTAVLAAAFIGPMQVAGRIAMVAAGDRASNNAVAIMSFTSMAVSITMLMLAGYGVGFIAGFAIFFGAAHGVVSIIRPGLTWEIIGSENFGAKSGALASMFSIGGAIAPFAGALIWQAGGYDTVLIFLASLAVLGLVLYLAANAISVRRNQVDTSR